MVLPRDCNGAGWSCRVGLKSSTKIGATVDVRSPWRGSDVAAPLSPRCAETSWLKTPTALLMATPGTCPARYALGGALRVLSSGLAPVTRGCPVASVHQA